MADTLVAERLVIRTPEKPATPKPPERPKQPLGPAEEKMVQTLDSLGDGQAPNPDKSLQAILEVTPEEPSKPIAQANAVNRQASTKDQTMPLQESTQATQEDAAKQKFGSETVSAEQTKTASTSDKLKTVTEQIAQETDSAKIEQLKQERVKVLKQSIPALTDETAEGFIAEFNESNELLQGLEFTLIQAHREKVLIVDQSGKLKEVSVTSQNARDVLREIKQADETIQGESYDLRQEILHRSGGKLDTWEAFTYGVDVDKSVIKAYLDDPENWVPERRKLHQEIVDEQSAKALQLSERFHAVGNEPTIYCLRGNTAAGKTTTLRGHERFKPAIDPATGEPTGAINPDTYKSIIRRGERDFGRQTISHHQAHTEGSMIARRIERGIAESQSSMIIDKRLNEDADVEAYVKMARSQGKRMQVLDVDAPLETSCLGVLTREPSGDDPLVPFDAIAEGFVTVRENRGKLMTRAVKGADGNYDTSINYYALYARGSDNQAVRVAEVVNGDLNIDEAHSGLFTEAVKADGHKEEVERVRRTVVDDDYIARTLSKFPEGKYQDRVRTVLEQNRGKTLEEALNENARRMNAKELSEDQYVQAAEANLEKTSRTAQGTIDTSASTSKASQMQEGLGQDAIAQKAKENLSQTIHSLYVDRDRQFSNPQELRDFVEGVATGINQGITKEGVLIRSGEDSTKYPYTPIAELEPSMQQFYQELYDRINNPNSDPVDVAAWAEYRIDLSDHFFADGCGKTAKAVSSWVLMRAGRPLPNYRGRDELYQNAPKEIRGRNQEIDAKQYKTWSDYYRSLF